MVSLNARFRRLRGRIYTTKEILLFMADVFIEKILRRKSWLYAVEHVKRVLKPDSDCYHIGDIRLPLLDPENERILSASLFDDDYYSYLHCNDSYTEEVYDRCSKFLSEGLYGLVNDRVNVTVEPGDIVIDAGSWIGDFAAYASVKGCSVCYAFEPSEENFRYLTRTAELNGRIIPVMKGLSDRTEAAAFSTDNRNSSSYRFIQQDAGTHPTSESSVETVRLDDFVRENNLPRVDFIKADIEGFERHMLAGAQETLARFAPKLALCTYHLPDDPQVMAGLIKQANPRYNIVQKRKKLFASVPKD